MTRAEGVETLPEKYIEEVLEIEKSLSDVEAPFVPPAPKPRGLRGSAPVVTSVPSLEPTQPIPMAAQPSIGAMNMWPGIPYPPFYMPHFSNLPSPVKRYAQAFGERPSSPIRRPLADGPSLEEWLMEFDEGLALDESLHVDLLPSLKTLGIRTVKDITLFKPIEIEEHTGCMPAMARRIVAKAIDTK